MASIETPNLHKAVPEDSMTVGDSACMHCGVTVRLVPGGNGPVWVHEDGHVLGYNECHDTVVRRGLRVDADGEASG